MINFIAVSQPSNPNAISWNGTTIPATYMNQDRLTTNIDRTFLEMTLHEQWDEDIDGLYNVASYWYRSSPHRTLCQYKRRNVISKLIFFNN